MSDNKVISPMQVLVMGRIEYSKFYDGFYYTQVTTPAADAYSRPQIVEIRSNTKLGQKLEVVSVIATLGGRVRKSFKATNKDTGEIVTVFPVDHTLDLVE